MRNNVLFLASFTCKYIVHNACASNEETIESCEQELVSFCLLPLLIQDGIPAFISHKTGKSLRFCMSLWQKRSLLSIFENLNTYITFVLCYVHLLRIDNWRENVARISRIRANLS